MNSGVSQCTSYYALTFPTLIQLNCTNNFIFRIRVILDITLTKRQRNSCSVRANLDSLLLFTALPSLIAFVFGHRQRGMRKQQITQLNFRIKKNFWTAGVTKHITRKQHYVSWLWSNTFLWLMERRWLGTPTAFLHAVVTAPAFKITHKGEIVKLYGYRICWSIFSRKSLLLYCVW